MTDWTGVIVAGCTAAGALGGLGALTHRKLLRPLRLMLVDWHGEPERRGAAGKLISEARPGVMERLTTSDTRMATVEREVSVLRSDVSVLRGDSAEVKTQLRPNHGDSTYDQAKRAADAAEHLAAVMEAKQ